jgi:hypothetical protein
MDRLLRTTAVITIAFLGLGMGHATAQETCPVFREGTVGCPVFGAPAATAVPGPSMDGGVASVQPGQTVTLFGGKVPPNGFMVRAYADAAYGVGASTCFVNDNGPASVGVGFFMVPDTNINPNLSGSFASPQGYKPIGPVSVYCAIIHGSVTLAARGW